MTGAALGAQVATETPFASIDAMLAAVAEIGWPICAERLEAMNVR